MRANVTMLISALLCAIAIPARAQDCATLHYVTGVSMTPAGSNIVTVPVTIDGVPKAMMLDTAISAPEGKLARAGLLVINPPYGFGGAMRATAAIIAPLLDATITTVWLAGAE